MEVIFMESDTDKIILNINDNKITGHIFHSDNTVEVVDKSIFNYFDFLKLSSNYTRLADEDDYHIYLDNETNYKHYFKNGVEDYKMFYINNGEDATLYDESNKEVKKESKIKKFFRKGMDIFLTIEMILSIAALTYTVVEKNRMIGPYEVKEFQEDVTLEEVRDLIYASPIEDKYKDLLYDEEYYKFVLPEINQSNYTKKLFRDSTTNLQIKFEKLVGCGGYYVRSQPNVLYIDISYKDTDAAWNTILHERKHSEEGSFKYSMFSEALAEIVSYEFSALCQDTSYPGCTQAIRELMEIIGTEPVWHFYFSGEDDKILDSVRPYLTDEEFMDFMYCIRSRSIYGSDSEEQAIAGRCRELLQIIAEKKNVKYDKDHVKDKMYFNNKDLHTALNENEMYLWDLFNGDTVKIHKYDQNGNYLGEASYKDLVTRFNLKHQRLDDKTYYEIEYTKKNYGWFGTYVASTKSDSLILRPVYKSIDYNITYDEYASEHQEEIEKNALVEEVDAYYNYYKKTELPENDKKPITYQDGSTIDFLENDVVKRTDKNGKETIYEVPKGVKMNAYSNGFITWEAPSGFCYRTIFPNGTVVEKNLVIDENNDSDVKAYRYFVTSGDHTDILNYSGNRLMSRANKDGNYRITMNGNACIDQFDKDGNKIGVMKFAGNDVKFINLEGKTLFNSNILKNPFCDILNYNEDNTIECVNKFGIVEHRSEKETIRGCTYPNGYSMKLEEGISIYDPNNEFVTSINPPHITGIDIDESGIICIYQENKTTKIYFGKYMVDYNEKNEPVSVTNFEFLLGDIQEM